MDELSTDRDADGEFIDAPEAPDYEDVPEEAMDLGEVGLEEWQMWPTWAKIRLLRRLRTEGAGRPEQYIDPALAWYLWALFGGRGSGKSLEANAYGAEEGLRLPKIRTALVARTFGDVRDTIFEGETGLLAIIPDHELRGGSRSRAYNRSLGELYLANGSKFKGFSAEKPNALRGPQHHRALLDEASSWEDADMGNVVDTTISNLLLGLRLVAPDGSGVRAVSSTTPKDNALTEFIEELAEKKGQVRTLTTYSNLSNLAEEVRDVVLGMYEGTDVAAQELEGRRLKVNKDAAWDVDMVARAQKAQPPPAGPDTKVTVGVDPAVSSKATSDETGLVAVSRTQVDVEGSSLPDRWISVLADRSGKIDVGTFPMAVWGLVTDVRADELVVEVNQGFDFVVSAITSWIETQGGTVARRSRTTRTSVRSKTRTMIEYILELEGHTATLKPVFQSLDKLTRAKAASAWWHRGRASHAAGLELLEKQMLTFDGQGKRSPDRLDALTSAVASLSEGRLLPAPRGASPLDLGGVDVAEADGPRHALLESATVSAGGSFWEGVL